MEDARDVLMGRTIYWCPGGSGHRAYCPGPIDPDNYVYCCTFFSETGDIPSCCPHSTYTGIFGTSICAAIIGFLLLTFLSCYICYWCPLRKRINANKDRNVSF